jgi:hypothetical protein
MPATKKTLKTPIRPSAAEPQRNSIAEWAVTIVMLLFGTATVAQAFVIPTGSMQDTLLIGDHLLVDKLFLIIDRNVASTFRHYFGVRFRKSTQPGYSVERYTQCLYLAQGEIRSFGPERFRLLEANTPEARIFDKIAWFAGRPFSLSRAI